MKKKRILVTGAAGFIGSRLTEILSKSNCDITAMYHYNAMNDIGNLRTVSLKKNVKIVKGDIRDYGLMRELAKSADCIINLAALIGIPYSYSAPDSYFETNCRGTLNLLNIVREIKNEQIIVISTSEIFGNPVYTPIDEKHPLNPQSPYAASKASAELFASSFIASFGTPLTIIRPFNTFGPRQSSRAVIPTIIRQALKGKTVRIGAADTARDFNYVDNTVSGIISAVLNEGAIGKKFNIGSGEPHSVMDVVETVSSIMNKKLVIESESKRMRPKKSEINLLLCDNSHANSVLGYKPRVSFIKGMEKTIDWYRKNPCHEIEDYSV